MDNAPRITVACVIERDSRFLLVREKSAGQIVYNQPAGHLEPGEPLIAAAIRETEEETGWRVEITQFLGIYHYMLPYNTTCYVRHCFVADPITEIEDAVLDPDILETCWLSLDEIKAREYELRSPLVIKVVEDFVAGKTHSLEVIHGEI